MNNTTIDNKSAYIVGCPIRTPHEMPTSIKTEAIGKEWEDNIKQRWWYHKNHSVPQTSPHITFDNKIFDLRERLLSFGGSEACLPVCDRDLHDILSRGQLWYGDRMLMRKGAPSRCHSNSAMLWSKNKEKYVLCTGYALSEDSMWRQHTWLIELRPKKNRVIETTTERVAYFGFAMTDEEANRFAEMNA